MEEKEEKGLYAWMTIRDERQAYGLHSKSKKHSATGHYASLPQKISHQNTANRTFLISV